MAFGGAGSYADVYLNGVHLGRHEGGQTGFCLEMTDQLKEGANLLAVRTDHPEKIMDLPWVCGGCFGTPNTEGTQPFGINRPVSVYTTGQVRIRPYGVWILPQQVKEGHPFVCIRTEVENLERKPVEIRLQSVIKTPSGETVEVLETEVVLKAGETQTVEQSCREIMGYSCGAWKHRCCIVWKARYMQKAVSVTRWKISLACVLLSGKISRLSG